MQVDVAARAGAAGAQLVVADDAARRRSPRSPRGSRRARRPAAPRRRARARSASTIRTPVTTIATATSSATTGSSHVVAGDLRRGRGRRARRARCSASVRRCAASPSSAGESVVARAAVRGSAETTRLTTVENADDRDAEAERLDLGAVDEAADRLEDDHAGADEDQHPLDRRGEVLDLLVAVAVRRRRPARRPCGRRRRRRSRRSGRSPSGSPR